MLFMKRKLFFDTRSIDGLDEQNILKLEVTLFCLKLKFETKQFLITDLFWKKLVCTHVVV
jgi:hypothetical protein